MFFSVLITVLDVKTREIPRILFVSAFLLFLTLVILAAYPGIPWIAIAGAAIGLAVFLLAYVLSKKKLGLADVWYSGVIGMVLGPMQWYIAISIACVTGVLFLLLRKKTTIPFTPFMAAGSAAVSLLQG